ncbi:hypothetical protein ATANTOWER_007222, partial [Ataeniobius toweri]|nr:hypothetical protein [Ataeniobius toweri]
SRANLPPLTGCLTLNVTILKPKECDTFSVSEPTATPHGAAPHTVNCHGFRVRLECFNEDCGLGLTWISPRNQLCCPRVSAGFSLDVFSGGFGSASGLKNKSPHVRISRHGLNAETWKK